ncbi:hypothetical protein PTKIN_Ptkin08bG0167000 [Pterospermum kingtungense]
MAEAMVSLAIQRISNLLIHEAVFLSGVGDELGRLKAELKRMQCFLKDADHKLDQDERLRNRVAEIRDLAYDAKDVIDAFILQAAHQGSFQRIIKRFTSVFTNKPFHLRKIGVQIKEIQTKLEDISKSLPDYDIPGEGQGCSSISVMQQRLRKTYPYVEEEDVVSLEGMTRDVLARLMIKEDRLHVVVSIVGMRGIGKTTLAKKVYNHDHVKQHFDCLAWAFISQKCSPREVLLDVLTKVHPPSKEERDQLGENELKKRLFDFLKGKRYLIVLDDIWRSEDWDILKPAFPRGKKGRKILFTTRNKDVALLADPRNSPIELPFLSDDDSWRLFKRKAFPTHTMESDACSKEFEMLGKEMVKKCGGLPLAIVVLGGLLATKRSQVQWEMVQRNIHAHINKVQQQDSQRLGDLKEELIRLWIAEGFISPSMESGGILMEDVGEQLLEELIDRCLLQVGKRDDTGRCLKTCRIHDLLRDLCIDKAREENFLETIQPSLVSHLSLSASLPRRIAIHPSKRYVCLKGEHTRLRSLLLFQSEELIDLHISQCQNFKLLRVSNLVVNRDYHNKWRVSSEIGNLHHLRYLKLVGKREIILPQSIGKLQSLQTLLVQGPWGIRIPDVVFKLERLRQVILLSRGIHGGGPKISLSFTGVSFERSKDVEKILKAVVQSNRLQSLHMMLFWDSCPDLEPLSQWA